MGVACCKIEKSQNPFPDGAITESFKVGGGKPKPGNHSIQCNDLDWMNFALAHMWPAFDQVVHHIVDHQLMPELKERMPDKIKDVKMTRCTLGDVSPVLGPVKVILLPHGAARIRCCIRHTSDMHIEMCAVTKYGSLACGLKDLAIACDIVVRISPLIKTTQGTGGVSVYLVDEPEIDFDFTGHASLVNAIGMKNIVLGLIENAISSHVVMPNVVTKLIRYSDLYMSPLMFECPEPLGLLRVELLEATHLEQQKTDAKRKPMLFRGYAAAMYSAGRAAEFMDNAIGKLKGVSTAPYLRLCVGDQAWKPDVKHANKNRSFDFIVFDPEQRLRISLWDRDAASGDDQMAKLPEPMELKEVLKTSREQIFLESPEGSIYPLKISSEWLIATPGKLNQMNQSGSCIVFLTMRELRQEGQGLRGRSLAIRAKLGSNVQSTPPSDASKPGEAKLPVLAELRENLEKAGVPKATIDKSFKKGGFTTVAINSSLNYVVNADALDSECKQLELILIDVSNCKHKNQSKAPAIATYSFDIPKLRDMPRLAFQGNLELNATGNEEEGGSMSARLTRKPSSALRVGEVLTLDVTIALCGLTVPKGGSLRDGSVRTDETPKAEQASDDDVELGRASSVQVRLSSSSSLPTVGKAFRREPDS